MRVNRGLLGWGIFFIVVGAVPLAVQAGILDASVVARAWELWPLILIGAGLGLLLARTRVAVVGGLVVAVTAGLMAGGLLAGGLNGFDFGDGFTTCSFRSPEGEPFPEQRGTYGGSGAVEIDLDCGEVTIASVAGDGWSVSGSSSDGVPPDIGGGDGELTVRAGHTDGIGRRGGSWMVELPQNPETSLDLAVNAGSARAALGGMALPRVAVDVNAGSATLDLTGARLLGRLEADVNAGSLAVSLPATSLTGSLAANAGSIRICVPDDVDLRITLEDNALGSNNFADAGLTQDGDTWSSEGDGLDTTRIELSASANLGSIELNPEDGCAD